MEILNLDYEMEVDFPMEDKKDWQALPEGGDIVPGGTAADYYTGGWRTFRPVLDLEKCINCLICWIFCPDSAIVVEDGKVKGFNYDICKGCGICAVECPPKYKAIEMIKEE